MIRNINIQSFKCRNYPCEINKKDTSDKENSYKKLENEMISQGYYKPCCKYTNIYNIKAIPNIHKLDNNALRGESLSSPKNRKFLADIKKLGIKNIIDLRKQYKSDIFPELCKTNDLNYYNIPVDSCNVPDKEIIENLPKLVELINEGNYYIACAQGLHRTDIALSLNYIFNPKSKEPPILYGHERDYGLKTDDIARRLHSVKNKITQEDFAKLGWDENSDFDEIFKIRKNRLFNFNKAYLNCKK